MVVGGFSWLLQWFRAPDHQNRCKNQETLKLNLRDSLKIVCVCVCFLALLGVYDGFGVFRGCWWFFVCFTVGLVVSTSKPL